MLDPPSGPAVAVLQSLLVAGFLLTFGRLQVGVLSRRIVHDGLDAWALAMPAVVLFVLMLQLVHMLSGGAMWSSPWVVRVLTVIAGLGTGLGARRAGTPRAPRAHVVALLILVAVAIVVWCSPVARSVPLPYKGDTKIHLGWASQLLNGETTPTAALTGDFPNYYPWLFHAFVAFVALFTPGGRAVHALAPVQVLLVAGTVLGLFALGRRLAGPLAGCAAGLFGALTGGFGFLIARKIDLILYARRATEGYDDYGGDLLFERPHNASFLNLAPPFPRDLVLVLLIALLTFLTVAAREGNLAWFAGAGALLGAIGLTGGEGLVFGGIAGLLTAFSIRGSRLRAVLAFGAPAVLLYLVWLTPMIVSYLRLGGFRSLAVGPIALSPIEVLIAWGITTPIAVAGAAIVARSWRAQPSIRVVGAAGLSAGICLIGPRLAGRSLGTLGFAHRYWPLAYLVAALCAAVAAPQILGWLAERSKVLALTTGGLVCLLALPSPVIGSLALPGNLPMPDPVTRAVQGDPNNLLNALGPRGARCRVAVPLDLTNEAFAHTGYRLLMYSFFDGATVNRARVRWDDLATEPDERGRLRVNSILTGPVSQDRWQQAIALYPLNAVAVEGTAGYVPPGKPAVFGDRRFSIAGTRTC
jgi:hypothetical protein